MTDPSLSRLEALFQAAADRPTQDRAAYLDRECGGDGDLRERVDALLARLDDDRPLGSPRDEEAPGSTIDRYRLLEVIGEGGFGRVYLAEQEAPVVRRVALKVLKEGMDTREVVARFEAERQALAMMDHPHIAKVLDGGATHTGRPYFVMELVKGVPVNDYLDGRLATVPERLGVFLDICRAVQHAHQKGVIHRDLKPTNVLVFEHEGRSIPRIIDFGIAKALHSRLTNRTLFTRHQQFVGTPGYMSPEQIDGTGLDVDTRTDIYSLGALLYELLAGSTPFDTNALWEKGLGELQRVLREEPPIRPSQRVRTAPPEVAARRSTDPSGLRRRLRGDLDWIMLRALAKERSRRYSSASELAEDIERHLRNEPVLAGPDGTAYRLRKFASRNRVAVVSAVLIAATLVVGAIGAGLGFLEASRQRDVAEREAKRVREVTAREATRVQHVTDFLVQLLSLADPQFSLSPDVPVSTLLDVAAAEVAEQFAGQPAAEARIRSTIGRAYATLGKHGHAERQLLRAIELEESLDETDLGAHYESLWAMTTVAFMLERPDCFEWAGRSRDVGLAHVSASHPALGAQLIDFHEGIERTTHITDPAPIAVEAAKHEPARELAYKTLRAGDPLWPIVADTFMATGYWTWYTTHEAHGARFFETALDMRLDYYEPGHPDVADSLAQWVGVLDRCGRAAEASPRLQSMMESFRETLPADSFQLAYVESMLGDNLAHQGQFSEAEPLLLAAHGALVAKAGKSNNFFALDSLMRLAFLYESWGRPEDARPFRDELAEHCARAFHAGSWPLYRGVFTHEHTPLIEAIGRIDDTLGGQSSAVHPAVVAEEDLESLETLLAEAESFPTGSARAAVLGRVLVQLSHRVPTDGRACERLARRAITLFEGWEESVPLDLADAHAKMAGIARGRGETSEAAEHAMSAARLVDRGAYLKHWFTNITRARIAVELAHAGRVDHAVSLLRHCIDIFEAQIGSDHAETQVALAHLARLEASIGDDTE